MFRGLDSGYICVVAMAGFVADQFMGESRTIRLTKQTTDHNANGSPIFLDEVPVDDTTFVGVTATVYKNVDVKHLVASDNVFRNPLHRVHRNCHVITIPAHQI